MDEAVKARIKQAWLARPECIRSAPASEDELRAFELRYGSIPSDFRWFLAECGGGVVGSEWVNNIRELSTSHDKFRREFGPPRGWTMEQVFVIGWDGSGNPFGIHTPTGELRVEDHNFAGVHHMAESFAHFLLDAFTDTLGNA